MKPDKDLLAAVERKVQQLEPQVARLLALIDEAERLREIGKVYGDSAAGGRIPDQQLLRTIREQADDVEKQIEKIVPLHAEFDLLRRLRTFYAFESGERPLEPVVLQRRRQQQRLHARQQVMFMRRRAEEEAARRDDGITSSIRSTFNRVASDSLNAGHETLDAQLRNSRAHPTERSRHESAAEIVTRSNFPPSLMALLANDQDRDASPGDEIAAATRDLLISRGLAWIRFGELYRSFLTSAFPHLFAQSPNENARIEAFRYHLSRAADKHGLRYERGRVHRIDAPSETIPLPEPAGPGTTEGVR